jgi:oligoribonuclease (3'-5' exoribonuclease)
MITFCFPDIETTGTDPDDDLVLEIAWTFTDEHFQVLGVPKSYVVKLEDDQWATLANRLRKTPFVQKMHADSGLLNDLTGSVTTDINDIASVFYEDLVEQINVGATIHFAGMSVEFDKQRLEKLGFRFEQWGVHHRLYNLSSVKLALENVGVPYQKPVNLGAHRAAFDVVEGIEQARIFRELFGHLPAV